MKHVIATPNEDFNHLAQFQDNDQTRQKKNFSFPREKKKMTDDWPQKKIKN